MCACLSLNALISREQAGFHLGSQQVMSSGRGGSAHRVLFCCQRLRACSLQRGFADFLQRAFADFDRRNGSWAVPSAFAESDASVDHPTSSEPVTPVWSDHPVHYRPLVRLTLGADTAAE